MVRNLFSAHKSSLSTAPSVYPPCQTFSRNLRPTPSPHRFTIHLTRGRRRAIQDPRKTTQTLHYRSTSLAHQQLSPPIFLAPTSSNILILELLNRGEIQIHIFNMGEHKAIHVQVVASLCRRISRNKFLQAPRAVCSLMGRTRMERLC